ncbi:hypothetical protein EI94DRAFT_919464 [Lactarius quietus]|nr:hypothetical protein EI94DRAFT_919464 [Lactarius quietus]
MIQNFPPEILSLTSKYVSSVSSRFLFNTLYLSTPTSMPPIHYGFERTDSCQVKNIPKRDLHPHLIRPVLADLAPHRADPPHPYRRHARRTHQRPPRMHYTNGHAPLDRANAQLQHNFTPEITLIERMASMDYGDGFVLLPPTPIREYQHWKEGWLAAARRSLENT